MRINGKHLHTIWLSKDMQHVEVIDQRKLPFEFEKFEIHNVEDAFFAIKEMAVRGAPLIGVAGAYGLYLGIKNFNKSEDLESFIYKTADYLKSSRPTAVNLANVIDAMVTEIILINDYEKLKEAALKFADKSKMLEITYCSKIGDYGLKIIEEIANKKPGETINILTHCNAGWLACIDWGTATAPIYKAFKKGIKIHVWVDETRPRNQGARLTAYELGEEGVPHTVIPDNTGGHLMQNNMVDMVIVGSDRATYTGDVANKIGTYLKALAAKDNDIPFYVAFPSTTIDWQISDGVKDIPIEERDASEVRFMEGVNENGVQNIRIVPEKSSAINYGFDVTPARLVSGFITERGVCEASEKGIRELFPERK